MTVEERKEYNKQYNITHKELRSIYYITNKDKVLEQCRQWRIKNRGKIKKRDNTWYINNKKIVLEKQYEYNLKRYYGINIEQYNDLFSKQEGKCSICNKHQTTLKNKLVVDHDHATGEIRGLLCKKCNVMIGFAEENIEILENTINYLKKYSNEVLQKK